MARLKSGSSVSFVRIGERDCGKFVSGASSLLRDKVFQGAAGSYTNQGPGSINRQSYSQFTSLAD